MAAIMALPPIADRANAASSTGSDCEPIIHWTHEGQFLRDCAGEFHTIANYENREWYYPSSSTKFDFRFYVNPATTESQIVNRVSRVCDVLERDEAVFVQRSGQVFFVCGPRNQGVTP